MATFLLFFDIIPLAFYTGGKEDNINNNNNLYYSLFIAYFTFLILFFIIYITLLIKDPGTRGKEKLDTLRNKLNSDDDILI